MRLTLTFITLFSMLMVVAPFAANAGFIDYPIVKLQALDKSTARTITFEAKVDSTIEYGSVFIKVKACRKSEPLEKPESASFLQIWEVPINSDKSEWIFSGWMFASSPALSAMNHPVYDVWVLDCLEKSSKEMQAQSKKDATEKTAKIVSDSALEDDETTAEEAEEDDDSEAENDNGASSN